MKVELKRVFVRDIAPVFNSDGYVAGFNVTLELRAAGATTVTVTVQALLANGERVAGTSTVTLQPGVTTVYVALQQPIDLNQLVKLDASAEPKA